MLRKIGSKKSVAVALVVLGIVCLVTWYFFWPTRIVAVVDRERITIETVRVYQQILEAYADDPTDPVGRREAFRRIVEDKEFAFVYRTLDGVPLTHEVLVETARQIDQETLAPSVLGKIQYALGGKQSPNYLNYFVAPALARSRVQNMLVRATLQSQDSEIQQLQQLVEGGDFESSAALYRSDIELPRERAESDSPFAQAVREALSRADSLNVAEVRDVGVVLVLDQPYIIRVVPLEDSVRVSLYSLLREDPMAAYDRHASNMKMRVYDPYLMAL